MKVVHVITGLEDGGAEAVLFRLCLGQAKVNHVVVSLRNEGKYGPLLRGEGIKVYTLNFNSLKSAVAGFFALYRILKQEAPQVVQTWMYHADLFGGLAARAARIPRVCWGVHHSVLSKEHSKRMTRIIASVSALVSGWVPKFIVYVAERGRIEHEAKGYSKSKGVVVPNGYDITAFKPNDLLRHEFRSQYDLGEGLVFGHVARYHPFKDHDTLLQAFGELKRNGLDFKLLLVGAGIEETNQSLVDMIEKHSLQEVALLLGQQSDIPAVMNAIDVNVLSSNSEAFPNVLCEAMACGTPCVTTNVGDASFIVGKIGAVVPIGDSHQLATALLVFSAEIAEQPSQWKYRCEASINRIHTEFSLSSMCNKYLDVWSA